VTQDALQHLMLPDPDLPHDTGVFVRLSGGAIVTGGAVTLPAAGAVVQGDTYANLFNLGTWTAHGVLQDLAIRLVGTGPVTLQLWQVTPTEKQTLIQAEVALTPTGVSLPLKPTQHGGLLMWSLTARDAAQVEDVCITARSEALPFTLAIVITTFKREVAVQKTATRIAAFLSSGALPGAHLFVIDNGQTVTLPADNNVTLIPNRNLGGAGGFARGLAAARATGGFTHALFMDDDAAFQMENLTRTAAFLRHAPDPRTAVAGAMVSAARPWELWENGAIFDQICHPQYPQADLRDLPTVTAMELQTPAPKSAGFYGGWWYFAFPLAGLRHDPFPFFVRGDDVSFSISNRFRIATLNGVMSLQDAFPAKASPQTAYLDARYHLHVHMVQDGMRLGRFGTIRVAMRLVLHSLMRMHYDTAAAQLLAWADMLQGPSLFTDTITMTKKRAQIAALIRTERWGPMPATLPPTRRATPQPAWHAAMMRVTLNGHLLPGFAHWGRSVTVPIADRGRLWSISGASRAVSLDGNGGAYTVTHSKAQFLRLMARAASIALRWGVAFPGLASAHRAAWPQMTTPAFWATQFPPPPAQVTAFTKVDPV
jgi:galactofuranosylgalactofuranosylrhamnosyl-N-acetylglucosaminyl-diphospho-decaprenol beta-1,5/1,6-galactofuranosyltransferase